MPSIWDYLQSAYAAPLAPQLSVQDLMSALIQNGSNATPMVAGLGAWSPQQQFLQQMNAARQGPSPNAYYPTPGFIPSYGGIRG
jgi:hypothetical protein